MHAALRYGIALVFVVFVVLASIFSLTESSFFGNRDKSNYSGVSEAISRRKGWSKSLITNLHLFMRDTTATEREGHRLFDLIGPVGPKCKNLESFGTGDGEKHSCGLKLKAANEGASCVVISIGSHNEWDFEESIYKDTNCITHTFDCTLPCQVPAAISSRTFFHDICIGPENTENGGKKFMNWDSIMDKINLHHPPTYLKMDIEGAEFTVLPNIMSSSKSLLPDQIAFELHHFNYERSPRDDIARSSGEIAMFMDLLYRAGGYFVVDRHDNPLCPFCTELLLQRFG